MPFFDTTGVNRDRDEGPLWNAFVTLRDQLERLITLNLAWSLQLIPGVVALAFPSVPLGLKIGLLLYSAIVLGPVTGLLFGLAARATDGEHLGIESAKSTLREFAGPSARTLAPLYGLLSLLGWTTLQLGEVGIDAGAALYLLAVGLRLLLLLLAICALYWGPMVVDRPDLSTWAVMARSARLVLGFPGRTLLVGAAVLLVATIGVISVGGLFLIVPVLIALLQTEMYRMASYSSKAVEEARQIDG
jgi:hypothetical protein